MSLARTTSRTRASRADMRFGLLVLLERPDEPAPPGRRPKPRKGAARRDTRLSSARGSRITRWRPKTLKPRAY